MNIAIPFFIAFVSITFASICGLRVFAFADLGSRILAILMILTAVVEAFAYFIALKYHNNMVLYQIFNPIQLLLLMAYFGAAIDHLNVTLMTWSFGFAGLILAFFNATLFQPIHTHNSNFLLIESVLVIGCCLYAFYRQFMDYEKLDLKQYHHFWFTSLIFLFWSVTFIHWGLYGLMKEHMKENIFVVHIIIFLVNFLFYSLVGYVFLVKVKRVQQ